MPERTMFRAAAIAAVGTTVAAAVAFAGASPALAAPTTVVTRTFSTAGAGTVDIPSSATVIGVTLAGGAGQAYDGVAGGTGGAVTVSLSDSFAGHTLSYVIGGLGDGSAPRTDGRPAQGGGGGSALADGGTLIAAEAARPTTPS